MKLMRKLEKQALARAAKEARKQQGKRKSFSVFWLGAQGKKFASIVFFLFGQLVTSKHSDLYGWCKKNSSRASGDTHTAYIAFVCIYVHIYFHRLTAQALIFFLL